MIMSFGNKLAENLFEDRTSKEVRAFPSVLYRKARMKLLYLNDAGDLNDMKIPPGNKLEALKNDLSDFHSIRINDQWRLIFQWKDGNAFNVSIKDYH